MTYLANQKGLIMHKAQEEGMSIYFCGEEQCHPGHFFGPAVRPHYLLHIILSGKGIFKKGQETYALKEGDAFLISPMESTYYQADTEEPWHYIWVGFDGFGIEKQLANTCFSNSGVFICPPDPKIHKTITHQAHFMIHTFHTPEHNPLTLLGHLYLLLGAMEGTSGNGKEEYSRIYLKRALEYMDNNYSYPVRIADIASTIGIDRTHLYRIFIQEEGISPKQYLLKLRLRTAAGMLRSPKYTVTEIAYSCGFKDAAAFCNQFKKSFHVTPRQFRENVANECRGDSYAK